MTFDVKNSMTHLANNKEFVFAIFSIGASNNSVREKRFLENMYVKGFFIVVKWSNRLKKKDTSLRPCIKMQELKCA